VLEPRARSARSPVCLFVVEHLPAVEHNAGVPWCADAVYSECMKHTRDMLTATRAVSIGPFCRVYRVYRAEPSIICTVVVCCTVYSSTGYRSSFTLFFVFRRRGGRGLHYDYDYQMALFLIFVRFRPNRAMRSQMSGVTWVLRHVDVHRLCT
jgi:hypothetical protein